MKCHLALIAVLLIAPIGGTRAMATESEARLATVMWAAFTCSTYAELFDKEDEQRRLFQLGYDSGRQFLDALQSGAISNDDYRQEVPLVVTLLLAGPNYDFVLGRIYEHSAGIVVDDLVSVGGTNTSEATAILAQAKFNQANCRLLAN